MAVMADQKCGDATRVSTNLNDSVLHKHKNLSLASNIIV